jgi:PilZ domain
MRQIETGPASNASAMDQRSSDRFGIALPITLEDGEGETLDLSETGILFETESEPQVGSRIGLTLQYSMDGQEYHMGCEAEVVRVERVGLKVNVAAKLLTPLVSEQ